MNQIDAFLGNAAAAKLHQAFFFTLSEKRRRIGGCQIATARPSRTLLTFCPPGPDARMKLSLKLPVGNHDAARGVKRRRRSFVAVFQNRISAFGPCG
jgi:hypothetical protein